MLLDFLSRRGFNDCRVAIYSCEIEALYDVESGEMESEKRRTEG
jgi:hypothetical protein